ncbi:MAG TPA: hypothetical protein VN442_17695 [Bryobacteraceae bacterium]|nr:hypothetical protein [Bryobacteraceae bacterium]
MDSSYEEMVRKAFLAVAGDQRLESKAAREYAALPGAVEDNTRQIAGLVSASQTQATTLDEILGSYTRVLANSPVYQGVQGEDGQGTASRVASSVLRNALGMVPLAKAVWGLFGGGGNEEELPDLVKYALPASLRFETAEGPGASLRGVDYAQDGLPRAYSAERAVEAGPQVTVQVQAMDSRSFLDHKEEIAQAVREAMLNTHSLNDVVNEL